LHTYLSLQLSVLVDNQRCQVGHSTSVYDGLSLRCVDSKL
jgi:hypothetical protein